MRERSPGKLNEKERQKEFNHAGPNTPGAAMPSTRTRRFFLQSESEEETAKHSHHGVKAKPRSQPSRKVILTR